MSLDQYRNQLPFGDDELREIRVRVMREIEKERARPRWLGVFARASLAAALLVLLIVPLTRHEPSGTQEERVASGTLPVQPSPGGNIPATRNAPPATRATPPAPAARQTTARHSRKGPGKDPRKLTHPHPVPEPASAESISAPMRIELHTSNPDIRILWITQPTGEIQ
jgi:hypothetical protein